MISAETLLADVWPLRLASNPSDNGEPFDGSCPCGHIKGIGFYVEFHCWRSGCAYECPYSGIHVDGELPRETLEKIARHIRDNNGWTDSTDWRLTVNGEEIK